MGNAGAIDWRELADRCGYDGPDDLWLRALRALCSTDDDEADFDDPWAFIGDNIESLGWSDVASLVALITNREAVPEHREALVDVLTRAATGTGDVVPFGYPAASTLAEAKAIAAGEREPGPGWEADVQRVRQQRFLIRVDAYYDVAEVLPDLLPLLADDDLSVRRGVANLVGCFPEKAGIVLPSLRARLDVETVPGVLATVAVSAAMLVHATDPTDATLADALTGLLTAESPTLRGGAAVALARLRGPDVPPAAVDELLVWAARPKSARYTAFDLAEAAVCCLRMCEVPADRALPVLVESLPRLDFSQGLNLARPLLEYTFPDGPIEKGQPFDALTPTQRWVMRAVAAARNLWAAGNFDDIMAEYGLPASAVKTEGEPEPFQAWVTLGQQNTTITERGVGQGAFLLRVGMEHADHVTRIKKRVDDRLHEEWSSTYEDGESFLDFLDTLFDAYIAEFRTQFPGTQVQVRKRNRLELSVLEGPPTFVAPVGTPG
ncbi:hypothetical protein [Actinomadura viridis]|uniref:HEAT repeat protein n=1 Tax=Actinomadura viridis TaxID=58110 RepID=A0A931DG56_9ACTN|nr:hypothetical protein [Actinomadura viridis]MBG6086138.1 hypothetical protein [Actinomadura viridis]